MPITLQRLTREHAASFCGLVTALAEFEKLVPPDVAAQGRLVEDALSERPRIEVWLAFVDGAATPCGYLILVETYSSFLALPTLYIEDVFVLPEHRGAGVGGALLKKAATLAHERGCGRMEWTALDWNVNAQRLYEQRLGAKRMSEWFLYRMTREDMARFLTQRSRITTQSTSVTTPRMCAGEGPSKTNEARLTGRTGSNRIVVFDGNPQRHTGEIFNVRIKEAGHFTLFGDAVLAG